jgi:hypothetical protein
VKKHHLLLMLLLAGIAAFQLNEARVLKSRESSIQTELALLRDAVIKSKGSKGDPPLSGKSANSRPSVIDSQALITDLTAALQSGEHLKELAEKYEQLLAAAPLSKLKEICGLLEKEFPLDQEGTEPARQLWLNVVGMAAKSDPAWAFAKLGQTASLTRAPVSVVLESFKRWSSQDGKPMGFAYATALQQWLEAAQADGRIEPGHPLVAELRAGIATAQGNSSAAAREIAQLPWQSQRQAAVDHLKALPTLEARRQAIEELSTALHPRNFPHVVAELANHHGVEAARGILQSASLTPEKHDLAAAGIAGAKIGPGTKEAAAWLLESLRSDDPRALETFTKTWTHGDHAAAGNWVNSLPKGPQRDAALKGFIPAAAAIDGATAMDWALTISDPLSRNLMYHEAHSKWQQSDPAQANAYQKSKPLDTAAVMAASTPQNPSD